MQYGLNKGGTTWHYTRVIKLGGVLTLQHQFSGSTQLATSDFKPAPGEPIFIRVVWRNPANPTLQMTFSTVAVAPQINPSSGQWIYWWLTECNSSAYAGQKCLSWDERAGVNKISLVFQIAGGSGRESECTVYIYTFN